MSKDELPTKFVIRNKPIRLDENGLVCLTDIWTLAKGSKNQKPADWWRIGSTEKLAGVLLKRIMGNTHKSTKNRNKSIYYGKGSKGTFAHPILACAYAGYLNPNLEVEVREVWLRYKGGDATLADEILSKASPEANEWAGIRAVSRSTRNRYTDTLQKHGVSRGTDFAACTNETYLALFDMPAKGLKKAKGVVSNLRDSMSISELSYVMASESLASERIEEMNNQGATQCQISTRTSANFIRDAIDKDRSSRQRNART